MLGFWQTASSNNAGGGGGGNNNSHSNYSRGSSTGHNSSNNSTNSSNANFNSFASGELTPRPSANPERNPFEATLSNSTSSNTTAGSSFASGQRSAPHSRKNSAASLHGIPAGLRTPTLQKSFVLPEVTSSVTATGLNTGSKSGKDKMTATTSLNTNSPRLSAFPRGSVDDGHSVIGSNLSRSTTPSRQLANPYPVPGSPKPSEAAASKNHNNSSIPEFKLNQPPKQHQHHPPPPPPPSAHRGGPTPQQKTQTPQQQTSQPPSKLSTSSSSIANDSNNSSSSGSTRATASSSTAPAPPPVNRKRDHASHSSLRGKLTVKIIEARDIALSGEDYRPYVVATFEQNEFVSREAIDHDEEAVGSPVSPTRSSQQRKERGPGARLKTGGEDEKMENAPGTISPANPVWKHEVAFDVTQENSPVTVCVYDRSSEEETFLGLVDIQPKQQHGWSVDDWYTLRPRQNEPVQGQVRVSIRFERGEVKRSLRASDFEFLRMIGKGTFGRVFQVRKKDTKRIYAMKVLSKREIIAKKEVQHTIGERKILQRSSDCPFLLGLKFSFQSQTELFLVMDFKSGGELFHHLQREGRFTEDRARFYAAEITLAFEYLHKYNIVYRDLKPENILLDATGHIVLCDFGLSKPDLPSNALTNTFCGTTEYLAPEVLLDDHGYSQTVDFWSLGVLLFEMCCGWSPFYAEDTQQMYKNICFGKIKFPRGVIGDDGKQFVKGLLNRNPAHRLGSKRDAAELKEHPFFKMIDWEALAARQVTVPFKPYVDSDESVSNFDPEFTEADILKEAPQDLGPFYDDWDLSGAWMDHPPTLDTSSLQQQQKESRPAPVPIASRDRMNGAGAGPLGDDAQDAFRGFSYSGDADLPDLMRQASMREDDD